MSYRTILTILTAALALAAFGCDSGSDMDSCGGPLSGAFSSSSPSVSFVATQCGAVVDGTLTIAGADYALQGSVEGGVFRFATEARDFCGTLGYRRAVFSSGPDLEIRDGGEELVGAIRVNDQNCGSSRTLSRGYSTTFRRQ